MNGSIMCLVIDNRVVTVHVMGGGQKRKVLASSVTGRCCWHKQRQARAVHPVHPIHPIHPIHPVQSTYHLPAQPTRDFLSSYPISHIPHIPSSLTTSTTISNFPLPRISLLFLLFRLHLFHRSNSHSHFILSTRFILLNLARATKRRPFSSGLFLCALPPPT